MSRIPNVMISNFVVRNMLNIVLSVGGYVPSTSDVRLALNSRLQIIRQRTVLAQRSISNGRGRLPPQIKTGNVTPI